VKYRSITVAKDAGDAPVHWLHKPHMFARRLVTACGQNPWTDIMGRQRRGVRNAYDVQLVCLQCRKLLDEAIITWETTRYGELYNDG
jgi:hypothetical protein